MGICTLGKFGDASVCWAIRAHTSGKYRVYISFSFVNVPYHSSSHVFIQSGTLVKLALTNIIIESMNAVILKIAANFQGNGLKRFHVAIPALHNAIRINRLPCKCLNLKHLPHLTTSCGLILPNRIYSSGKFVKPPLALGVKLEQNFL